MSLLRTLALALPLVAACKVPVSNDVARSNDRSGGAPATQARPDTDVTVEAGNTAVTIHAGTFVDAVDVTLEAIRPPQRAPDGLVVLNPDPAALGITKNGNVVALEQAQKDFDVRIRIVNDSISPDNVLVIVARQFGTPQETKEYLTAGALAFPTLNADGSVAETTFKTRAPDATFIAGRRAAVAKLASLPDKVSRATALAVTVAGQDVVDYQYALLSGATDCRDATYGDWTPVATPLAGPVGDDGAKLLCVVGRDAAGNVQRPATFHAWTKDTTPPAFYSVALANDAADGFVNAAEHAGNGTELLADLKVEGGAAVVYAVTAAANACDATLAYAAAVPRSNDAAFGADGAYKVCLRLTDAGGNVGFAASASFALDTTAPKLLATAPADGATDAGVRPSIALTFDEPLAPASATAASVVFTRAGRAAPLPGAPSVAGATLTFLPDAEIEGATDHRLTVTTGVTDAAGNPLAAEASVHFQTPRSWRAAKSIYGGTTKPSAGAVAFDGLGRPVALWLEPGSNSRTRLMASRSSLDEGWSAPVNVDATGTGYATLPTIGADASGNVFIMWQEAAAALSNNVWIRRWNSDDTWGAPMLLESGIGVTTISLAVNAAGQAVAAWTDTSGDFTTGNLNVRRYTPGTGWSGAAVLATGFTEYAGYPIPVGLDAAGNAEILWRITNSGTTPPTLELWSRRYSATGGTWSAATLVTSTQNPLLYYDMTVGSDGAATLLWLTGTMNNVTFQFDNTITVSRDVGGAGWSAPQLLDSLSLTTVGGSVDVEADAAGHVLAAWSFGFADVHTSRFQGGMWEAPKVVTDVPPVFLGRLLFNPAGEARTLWHQVNNNDGDLLQSSRWDGTQWGAVEAVSTVRVTLTNINAAAMSADGRAITLYTAKATDDLGLYVSYWH